MDDNKIPTISGRDSTIPLASLLKASKEDNSSNAKISPLQQMAEEKKVLGIIVENKDLEEAEKKNQIKYKDPNIESSEIATSAYLAEMDKKIEAAKELSIARPNNDRELIAIMDSLDSAVQTGTIPVEKDIRQMVVPKKTIESNEAVAVRMDPPETIKTPSPKNEESTTVEKEPEPEVSEKTKQIVKVLIDKTGLGADVYFTNEEKEKLSIATEIRVKEIQDLDISTINVIAPEESFVDSVSKMELSSSKVTMAFPASRFRADMYGLSYGEMGDIALNQENTNFDKYRKMLTVIYNKMKNPSCGEFKSFEDFLHKFAFVDIDMAVYGLFIATYPEIDDITLTCGSCHKDFTHKFSTRSILNYEKCGEKFLEATKQIVDCPPGELQNLVKESPVTKHSLIRLPISKFLVEVGISSSYNYLYNVIDNVIGNKFKEEHPDDVNDILHLNTLMLSGIQAVYVPDKIVNGKMTYKKYVNYEDMINALYMIKPEEVSILINLLARYSSAYNSTYEIRNVICPLCGQPTDFIPVEVSQLIFFKYRKLMNTELDTSNILIL